MTATDDILARVGAVTEGLGGTGGRAGGSRLEDRELAALRSVLVGPERTQLRKILQRLDDPATRAAEIAKILPEAIALRAADDQSLAETLTPIVRDALADALRERPDLLARAARTALRHMMFAPWRWFRGIFRRHRGEPATIEQLFLVERETGHILEQLLQPLDADNDYAHEEGRRIASMVTYLLAFLRDPEHLMRYADLGQVRVERLTYGISAGASVVLLCVVRGQRGVDEQLERCRDMLIAADREWFNGKRAPGGWLPPLGAFHSNIS